MKLYSEFREVLYDAQSGPNMTTDRHEAAYECAKIAVQSQIELLEEIHKHATKDIHRLIRNKIDELESQP